MSHLTRETIHGSGQGGIGDAKIDVDVYLLVHVLTIITIMVNGDELRFV